MALKVQGGIYENGVLKRTVATPVKPPVTKPKPVATEKKVEVSAPKEHDVKEPVVEKEKPVQEPKKAPVQSKTVIDGSQIVAPAKKRPGRKKK